MVRFLHTCRGAASLLVILFMVGPFGGRASAQESGAQVVMRPITTVHAPLVIRTLPVQVADQVPTRVEVGLNPLNGEVTLRSLDMPGDRVTIQVVGQSGMTWYTGSMRSRKGSDRFATESLPAGRYAVQVVDEREIVRHRYLLIKQ